MPDSEPGKSPFTPNPNRRPFDRPRAESRITDHTPVNDVESPFQAAAIKCAQMEAEIYSLAETIPMKEWHHGIMVATHNGIEITHFASEDWIVNFTSKDIAGSLPQGTSVALYKLGETWSHFAELTGIQTSFALKIKAHIDPPTQEVYREYVTGKSIFTKDVFETMYLFGEDGEAAKLSFAPLDFETASPTLSKFESLGEEKAEKLRTTGRPYPKDTGKVYESIINQGDFELAGPVLQMFINGLKPHEKPAE